MSGGEEMEEGEWVREKGGDVMETMRQRNITVSQEFLGECVKNAPENYEGMCTIVLQIQATLTYLSGFSTHYEVLAFLVKVQFLSSDCFIYAGQYDAAIHPSFLLFSSVQVRRMIQGKEGFVLDFRVDPKDRIKTLNRLGQLFLHTPIKHRGVCWDQVTGQLQCNKTYVLEGGDVWIEVNILGLEEDICEKHPENIADAQVDHKTLATFRLYISCETE